MGKQTFIGLLGTKVPKRLNVEIKQHKSDLCEAFTDLTA